MFNYLDDVCFRFYIFFLSLVCDYVCLIFELSDQYIPGLYIRDSPKHKVVVSYFLSTYEQGNNLILNLSLLF